MVITLFIEKPESTRILAPVFFTIKLHNILSRTIGDWDGSLEAYIPRQFLQDALSVRRVVVALLWESRQIKNYNVSNSKRLRMCEDHLSLLVMTRCEG